MREWFHGDTRRDKMLHRKSNLGTACSGLVCPNPLLGPGDLGYLVQMGNNSQHLGLGPEQDSCVALKPDSAKHPLRLANPCSALL